MLWFGSVSHVWPTCATFEVHGITAFMMLSWHGNAFCITGPLWEESTSRWCFFLTKGQWCRAFIFPLISAWTNCQTKLMRQVKLEQLECLRSENTPDVPWLPILWIHIRSHVITRWSQSYKFENLTKIKILEFHNFLYTGHTFWSCLITCANIWNGSG